MQAKKVETFNEAEKLTGLSIKVPSVLFGKKAQVYVSDPNHVNIFYTGNKDWQKGDGGISIGRREPQLASYDILVEQWQFEGAPVFLRDHKGHQGYVFEDGVNEDKFGNVEPRPASVVWLKDGVQHIVVGPDGLSYKKLIKIADDID